MLDFSSATLVEIIPLTFYLLRTDFTLGQLYCKKIRIKVSLGLNCNLLLGRALACTDMAQAEYDLADHHMLMKSFKPTNSFGIRSILKF